MLQVLPELMKACMRTKSGAVRCGALGIIVKVAERLTEQESTALIRMLAKITAVDKTPATLKQTLAVRPVLWLATWHRTCFACMDLVWLVLASVGDPCAQQLTPHAMIECSWQSPSASPRAQTTARKLSYRY